MKDANPLLDLAAGEALFGSFLLTAIITKLVDKGMLTKQEIAELIDGVLLVFERNSMECPSTVVNHARKRLEALLAHYSPHSPRVVKPTKPI